MRSTPPRSLKLLRINSERLAKIHAFRCGEHLASDDLVVYDFGYLARTDVSAVEDFLAHSLEDDPRSLEVIDRRCADHEGQRRCLSAHDASRHRCVAKDHIFRSCLVSECPRCVRRDCAHVADHRAFTGAVEDATGTRNRVLDVLGLRQSGDDVVHVLAGLGE